MLYLIFSEEGGKKRMTPFMEWNLNCLRAIAELRTPLLDTLMQGVTELGGETLFMLFMLVVFWCVDKNKGYFLMLLCFTGTAVNQTLKITFCIPRPWVLDPSFEIVESARAGASGFSFPSGHTQNAVAAYGGMFCITKKLWVRVVCMALALLIPFSRLYLGVHTPLDVGVSFVIGWLLVLAFYPLLEEIGHRGEVLERIWLILLVPAALFLLYALRVRAARAATRPILTTRSKRRGRCSALCSARSFRCSPTGTTRALKRRPCGGRRSSRSCSALR